MNKEEKKIKKFKEEKKKNRKDYAVVVKMLKWACIIYVLENTLVALAKHSFGGGNDDKYNTIFVFYQVCVFIIIFFPYQFTMYTLVYNCQSTNAVYCFSINHL